jgi:hypothetical protein
MAVYVSGEILHKLITKKLRNILFSKLDSFCRSTIVLFCRGRCTTALAFIELPVNHFNSQSFQCFTFSASFGKKLALARRLH